jgi:Mn2+/Fe2+ NRAMP family transporter
MSQSRTESDYRSTYHTPRWVKIFGIVVLALILLVAVVIVTGLGGEHGPGRHTPPIEQEMQPDAPTEHTPPI